MTLRSWKSKPNVRRAIGGCVWHAYGLNHFLLDGDLLLDDRLDLVHSFVNNGLDVVLVHYLNRALGDDFFLNDGHVLDHIRGALDHRTLCSSTSGPELVFLKVGVYDLVSNHCGGGRSGRNLTSSGLGCVDWNLGHQEFFLLCWE